jgi:hypothetical protein
VHAGDNSRDKALADGWFWLHPKTKAIPVIRINRCGHYGPFEAEQNQDEG